MRVNLKPSWQCSTEGETHSSTGLFHPNPPSTKSWPLYENRSKYTGAADVARAACQMCQPVYSDGTVGPGSYVRRCTAVFPSETSVANADITNLRRVVLRIQRQKQKSGMMLLPLMLKRTKHSFVSMSLPATGSRTSTRSNTVSPIASKHFFFIFVV